MAELGRISGPLLKDNLLRDGVDLSFRNNSGDVDLLYLDVSNSRIGINDDSPSYEVDVSGQTSRTQNIKISEGSTIANILINGTTFSSNVGAIEVRPYNQYLFHDRLQTSGLEFDGNAIKSFSNQNIEINPNGSGTINLLANTITPENINVSGNIVITGNLSYGGNLIIGDDVVDGEALVPENDVIDFNVDFAQSLIPGIDLGYDLGIDRGDSTPRRWAQANIRDWSKIIDENLYPGSGLNTLAFTVSNQLTVDGVGNQIFSLQSNDDVIITPDSGRTFIDNAVHIQENTITNLVQLADLNAVRIKQDIEFASIGDSRGDLWNNTMVEGITVVVVGPGSSIQSTRIGKLGDVANRSSTPNIIDSIDITAIENIGNQTGSVTLNDQLWYHSAIKPTIFSDPDLFIEYGNGESLSNQPITLASTGIGYYVFSGNSGMVIPSGTSDQREYNEVGETRWNTDEQYLECYDGSVYLVSTGPGAVVTVDTMTELAVARALIFG